MVKKSLNNFICHLSWLRKLSPTHTHPLISICEFSKPYELLFLEFESFIKCKIWMVKNHSIILSLTCHGLETFPHSYTCPHIHLWIFESLQVIIFLVWVLCKWLNANWDRNWLNNFICHLSFLSHFLQGWMWIGKKFTL